MEHTELLGHVLVPVATADDATTTARQLEPYDPAAVTVMHLIEKSGSDSGKSPAAASEEIAEDAFEAFREVFPDAETHTMYGRGVSEAIFDAATELDATAIAYSPRGGGRLMQFLSGDLSLKLVTNSPIPVIALPQADDS
jgi:nucleotide-binding universal stress UspA family protein